MVQLHIVSPVAGSADVEAVSADVPSALSAQREYWSIPKILERLRRCAGGTPVLPAMRDLVLSRAGDLALDRSFVRFGAAVLYKLNNEGSGGHEQKNMDHAAFVQQKPCDQPTGRHDGAYDPEHFEIDSLVV